MESVAHISQNNWHALGKYDNTNPGKHILPHINLPENVICFHFTSDSNVRPEGFVIVYTKENGVARSARPLQYGGKYKHVELSLV